MNEQVIIGVDVGGTNTVLGLFTPQLELIAKCEMKTRTDSFTSNVEVIPFLDRLILEMARLLQAHGKQDCDLVVGMGVPGRVNSDQGIVCSASNLGWENIPIADQLSKRLRSKVKIDNDVRMYTLGEIMDGIGKGCHSAIGVVIGTGVAASVYLHGSLVQGHHWYAGEIGHDPVTHNSLLCKCGRIGCMETIVSAPGLERMGNMDAISLYEASLAGNEEATHYFHILAETLAFKLLTCSLLIDPEIIIVGGGVAAAGPLILDPILKVFREHYREGTMPNIRFGTLGDEAGIFGAARLATS